MTAFDQAWELVKDDDCPFNGVCPVCGDCPYCDYDGDIAAHDERCPGRELASYMVDEEGKVVAQGERPR